MLRFLYKWHSRIGIIAAVFVVAIAASGIALNHSHGLSLAKSTIKTEWLLDIYNIKPSRPLKGFKTGNDWVSQVDDRIYFNDVEIAKDIERLYGVVETNAALIIAMNGQLLMINRQGEIIEHLYGAQGVPAGMRAIGKTEQGYIVIRAAHGFYQVDLDALHWREFDYLEAEWSTSAMMPARLKHTLLEKYRGSVLTLERVILDLHSGRIFGQWGVYLFDLVALLFIFSALSGTWLWWRH